MGSHFGKPFGSAYEFMKNSVIITRMAYSKEIQTPNARPKTSSQRPFLAPSRAPSNVFRRCCARSNDAEPAEFLFLWDVEGCNPFLFGYCWHFRCLLSDKASNQLLGAGFEEFFGYQFCHHIMDPILAFMSLRICSA